MGNKNKRTGKPKGITNSQVNFMIAKAMRSGAFKKITALAESGATKDEVKLALMRQYSPNARPDQLENTKDAGFLAGHIDKLADQIIARYGPKDEAPAADEPEEPKA